VKLIKFKNGNFGIRKGGWFTGYLFKDFKNERFWWSIDSTYFEDCKTDEETARRIFNNLTDLGEVIE
jgi:beta-lactamase class D